MILDIKYFIFSQPPSPWYSSLNKVKKILSEYITKPQIWKRNFISRLIFYSSKKHKHKPEFESHSSHLDHNICTSQLIIYYHQSNPSIKNIISQTTKSIGKPPMNMYCQCHKQRQTANLSKREPSFHKPLQ